MQKGNTYSYGTKGGSKILIKKKSIFSIGVILENF